MAAKARKDKKGYALRTGECQRKDGRYSYSYTDRGGVRHSIYAKTLVDLRAREKTLQRAYDEGIDPVKAARLTINDMYDRYISQKFDLKETTRSNYKYMYNHFVRDTFGKQKLQSVRFSDVKQFYISILKEGREYEGWLPVITVLLGTGMRIGECLGLRWEDLDFKNRMISVNHNLTDRPDDNGKCGKHIQSPKTAAGNNAIHRAVSAYNKKETARAMKEDREALLLPDFSAHNLRHTFCTRFCENETNLKVIQDIMGHADISTTMDIYAEATEETKKKVLTNLEGKIII